MEPHGGLGFSRGATIAGAIGGCGYKAGGRKEPAGQRGGITNRVRLARQHNEDRLGNVFREAGITHLSSGRGIDEIDVTMDQLAECGFRSRIARTSLSRSGIVHERRGIG